MAIQFTKDVSINGSATISQIANATVDTNTFLVSDAGVVKYRTGSEVLSDLGVDPTVKAGVAINKGQAVYVYSADGTNIIVRKASNLTEAESSKTLGLLDSSVPLNGMANVISNGLLEGLDTSTAIVGDPVWLGEAGNLIYGLANKPYAPKHLVYIGVVTRVNVNNGEIFINVQNGFELNELHDVDLKTVVPVNGDILGYNGTLWVNKTIAAWLGYTPANDSNVVHKTGDETIVGVKTFNGTTNSTTSVFNLAAVNNSPSGSSVPDSIRSTVNGHNGTSASLVSCFYGTMQGNRNVGVSAENHDLLSDATNSVGFRSVFKDTSTTNSFFIGKRGSTNVFRVDDYGNTFSTKLIAGTTIDNGIDALQVSGSTRSITTNPDGITAKILTFPGTGPSFPYGLVFRSDSFGNHSIQNQREANNAELFPLILQPLGGNLGVGTITPVGKFNVLTGLSGDTLNIVSQESGSISFANGSASATYPVISGKSNNNSGLTLVGATNNTNAGADMSFNVRENDNTDFTTTTSSGFKFLRFGTTLIDVLRNGNTTFSGDVTISKSPANLNLICPSGGSASINLVSNSTGGGDAIINTLTTYAASGDLVLKAVNTEGIRIRSSGKVLIGTTVSSAKLAVETSAHGPVNPQDRATILANNTSTDATYANSIGIYAKTATTGGYAVYGENTSTGYGGYFLGKGYFSGNLGIGTVPNSAKLHVVGDTLAMGGVFTNQAAPLATGSGATVTGANLVAGLITNTGVGWTMPNATSINSAFFPTLATTVNPVNGSFDWSIINTSASSFTISMTSVTGHTFVGNLVVNPSASARYRTVKTGISTYITYRIS